MKTCKILIPLFIILLVTACSNDQTDTDHLASAKDFLDNNNLKAATIQLKNALQENPDNAEARRLLGKTHLEVGNDEAAEKELKRALELGVLSEAIYPMLAHALDSQSKYDELLALDINGFSPEAQADILATQGKALIAQNKLGKAEDKIDQALSLQADSASALTEQARLITAKGAPSAQARDLLTKLLKTHKKYAPAWSLLGQIERRDQKREQSEAALSKAIEFRTNNTGDLLQRALLRIELENYQGAQADINLLKKKIPNYYELQYAQGLIHFNKKQYPLAQTAFEASLKANEQFLPTLFFLGATYYNLEQLEQANTFISRFVSANPNYTPGRKLFAQIQLQYGNFAEVEKLMLPVIRSNPEDVVAMNLLAVAYIKQNQAAKGVLLLERIVSLQPDSAKAHLTLGSGLLAKGDKQKGLEQIKMALKLDANTPKADETLIRYYLSNKNFKKAFKAAEAFQKKKPTAAQPYNLLGFVHLAKGETKAAKNAFVKAQEKMPYNIIANNNLAALAIADENYTEAKAYYENILAHHTDHLDTLMNLSSIADSLNRRDEMVKLIQQAIEAHPEAAQARIALARHYLDSGASERVSVALGELQQRQPNNPLMLDILGRSQLAQREGASAQTTFKQLSKIQPKAAQAQFLLALAEAQLGNTPAIQSALKKAIQLDPDHLPARIALARLFLIKNDIQGLNQQLAVLKKSAPDNPDVMLLEGAQAQAGGKQDQALNIYTQVFENVSSTTSMLKLAQQTWSMGKKDETLTLLKRWVNDNPDSISARLRLASAYQASNKISDAITQYSAVIKKSGKNIIALNNLAWLLRNEDSKQAVEYAEKAADIAPNSAQILDTTGMVYLQAGQITRAVRTLRKAIKIADNNSSIKFHLAQALIKEANTTEARQILETITNDKRSFAELDEARSLLMNLK